MKTLTACYDLAVSPPTYDFFTFLAEAERFRVHGDYKRIDIVFQPGTKDGFRDDDLPPDLIERRSMLQRVCVAGARLLPTVSDVVCFGQRTNIKVDFPVGYDPFRPVSHYGACYQLNGHQCLRATDAARREVKRLMTSYTTITLREAEYWPARNSNFEAWCRAARWLESNGMSPIIIPDTHGSMRIRPGEGFPAAAWDIDLRMALYEGASLNIGVATGPMSLCMLAEKAPPYIMLNVLSEDGAPAHKEEFLASHGLKRGDHFSKNGWTLWEKDTPENVIGAIESWFKKKAVA